MTTAAATAQRTRTMSLANLRASIEANAPATSAVSAPVTALAGTASLLSQIESLLGIVLILFGLLAAIPGLWATWCFFRDRKWRKE